MVEDLFSGLLEGLVEGLVELIGEVLGWMLEGVADWFSGGVGRGDEDEAAKAVERYKFPPRDLDK